MASNIPLELKLITPHLQRARETKIQHPVLSYWCTYYALQLALSTKFKEKNPQRTAFLSNLMDSLEEDKQSLATQPGGDIISDISASSAYIENFSLKLFAAADNEDRRGEATRHTAKKFLAAANFFELLKSFDNLDHLLHQQIEEKVRYAKWKAGDISKAIREGRQPARGGPNDVLTPDSQPSNLLHSPSFDVEDLSPSGSKLSASSSPSHVPSNELLPPATPQANRYGTSIPSDFVTPKETPINPGLWSNTATPGEEKSLAETPTRRPVLQGDRHRDPDDDDRWSNEAEVGSRSNSYVNARPSSDLFTPSPSPLGVDGSTSLPEARVTGESLPPPHPPPPLAPPPASLVKKVHWTPSVTGGSSVGGGSPPGSPEKEMFIPKLPPTAEDEEEANIHVNGHNGGRLGTTSGSISTYAPPGMAHVSNQGYSGARSTKAVGGMGIEAAMRTEGAGEVELTHGLIATVQKHCRFAISSLDYEDAEQARKELRAALRLLGG